MIAAGLTLCAAGLLAIPAAGARRRLDRLLGKEKPARSTGRIGAALRVDGGRPALWAAVVGLPLVAAGWPSGVAAVPVAVGTWHAVRAGIRRSAARAAGPGDGLRLAGSWDLLAACLRSGMAVPVAVRAVADGAPIDVARRLNATADLLLLGADPAQAWAQARGSPALAELARAACRTARSGAALAEVAANLAERVRSSLGDQAEARAQRAGVLITGPLGLCFLPAFLCLGVIPVVLGLADRLTVL